MRGGVNREGGGRGGVIFTAFNEASTALREAAEIGATGGPAELRNVVSDNYITRRACADAATTCQSL